MIRHDAEWHARVACVLSGALRMWGVTGTVTGDRENGFALSAAGLEVRITRAADSWRLWLRDPASGVYGPFGAHAGLAGLLRRLREELSPDAPAGRLVVGAQPLLERDASAR